MEKRFAARNSEYDYSRSPSRSPTQVSSANPAEHYNHSSPIGGCKSPPPSVDMHYTRRNSVPSPSFLSERKKRHRKGEYDEENGKGEEVEDCEEAKEEEEDEDVVKQKKRMRRNDFIDDEADEIDEDEEEDLADGNLFGDEDAISRDEEERTNDGKNVYDDNYNENDDDVEDEERRNKRERGDEEGGEDDWGGRTEEEKQKERDSNDDADEFTQDYFSSSNQNSQTRELAAESVEIPPQIMPDSNSHELCIIRFPPNVTFLMNPFECNKEPISKTNSSLDAIRWRFKKDKEGNLMENPQGEFIRESNTNLVEWSDGSYSLFIGDRPFECQVRNDVTYVFENSLDEIKPLHAVVSKRFQARTVNCLVGRMPSGMKSSQLRAANRQKTKLTSIDEALANERHINEELEHRKETDRLRRKHRNASIHKGLTRNFLEESENDENDDEGNITKIKETFRLQKRR